MGCRVAVEAAGLVLGDPDLNQITADAVALGEGVGRVSAQKLLDDLALELDRMRAVLSHGLSPRKPGSVSRFSGPPPVHSEGCTPIRGQIWAPIDNRYLRTRSTGIFRHPGGPAGASRAARRALGRDRLQQVKAICHCNSYSGSYRRQCGISLIVRTTLEVGRLLTVGSLFSFCTSSSYCASVCNGAFGTMCTTL